MERAQTATRTWWVLSRCPRCHPHCRCRYSYLRQRQGATQIVFGGKREADSCPGGAWEAPASGWMEVERHGGWGWSQGGSGRPVQAADAACCHRRVWCPCPGGSWAGAERPSSPSAPHPQHPESQSRGAVPTPLQGRTGSQLMAGPECQNPSPVATDLGIDSSCPAHAGTATPSEVRDLG